MDFGAGDRRKTCGGTERLARAALAALWTSVSPMAVGWPADARAQSQAIEFDIPSQPIATALVAFARQANVRLVMSEEPSGGVATNALRGVIDRERALEQLLKGTGYDGRFEDGAIRLWRASAGSDDRRRGAQHENDGALVELAQGGAPTDGLNDEVQAREARASEESADDEIVVVGTNIRGVYPSSSPVEIYTAEDIADTGATTTEQFIGKLPQNLGTRTQFASGSTTTSGTFVGREGVNGVDLRGLGVGTTLILLNGRRMALASSGQSVDVSLIPSSAIARVEVLTDGASAVYGSDAIGGVVNFVLRDDVDGGDTRLRYGGVTDGRLRQGNFTQTFGRQWQSGNALFSYDYLSASPLETGDRAYAAPSGPGYLTPVDQRHSALTTFSRDFGDKLTLSGDLAYSRRDVKNAFSLLTNPNPLNHSNSTYRSHTDQYFANVGANLAIGESLNGSILATYSNIDIDSFGETNFPNRTSMTVWDTNYSALDLTAKIDGALLSLPAGRISFSLGGGHLDEQYRGARTAAGVASGRDLGRGTTYAFGEVLVPFFGTEQRIPLVYRLELSLAARYTRYDDSSEPPLGRDFGDNTSPKVGLVWSPAASLNIRGTFGESFRAPTLTEIDPLGASGSLRQPFRIGGVASTALLVGGPSPDLGPETAETYTLGFDYKPRSYPGFRLTATYFNIDYDNRIAAPNPLAARADPAAWPDLVYRPASAAQIEELLRSTPVSLNETGISLDDPHVASIALFALPDLWISDGRVRNLSVTELDGFDVGFHYRSDTSWGEISVGGELTRILDYHEQATSTAPVITVVDTVLRPVDLRARISVGATSGGLQSTLNFNYVDDYASPLAPGGDVGIESWTTVDWNVSYEFFEKRQRGLLDGLRLTLSVQNLVDEEPPFVGGVVTSIGLSNPQGFDPANANPLGRLIVFGISKAW